MARDSCLKRKRSSVRGDLASSLVSGFPVSSFLAGAGEQSREPRELPGGGRGRWTINGPVTTATGGPRGLRRPLVGAQNGRKPLRIAAFSNSPGVSVLVRRRMI